MDTERINALLEKGEQIRWMGRPNPGKLMDEQNRKPNTLWFIVSAVIFISILILLAITSIRQGTSFFNVFTLFAVLIGGVITLSPYTTYRKLKKVIYAVTNKHILVSANETTKIVLDLKDADSVTVLPGNGEYSSLTIGSPVKKIKPHKMRDLGLLGYRYDVDEISVVYPVFYNIEDAEKVKEIIETCRRERVPSKE